MKRIAALDSELELMDRSMYVHERSKEGVTLRLVDKSEVEVEVNEEGKVIRLFIPFSPDDVAIGLHGNDGEFFENFHKRL